MRMRKELERKRPTRRKTEQYWSAGQFRSLIEAGPAKLASRSMIPYQVLIYLLTRRGSLHEVRRFLSERFNTPERVEKFQKQLDGMLDNLQALGYLTRSPDGEQVALDASVRKLLAFRSVDPLYGVFLADQLTYSNFDEKVLALESVLEVPTAILRKLRIPDELPKGPLQERVLEPLMVQMGVVIARPESSTDDKPRWMKAPWELDDEPERPPTFPEMLKIAFDARLAAPEAVPVQPKWVAGGVFQFDGEFFKFVRSRELIKQEGLILRHLLRLVILAGEFLSLTDDPDYQRLGELATQACRRVDARYTDRFLAEAEAMRVIPAG